MSTGKQFGAHTKALELVEGIDLSGYEVVVTGANSGIGVETVRALAKAGARCVICSRDVDKAAPVRDDIVKTTGNLNIEIEQLELDSLENVDAFVKRFLAKKRFLNILINNAGVMGCPKSYTKDGFEYQFGTNHMGHFALTLGLLPALIEGYKATGHKSRVINLSSSAHAMSDIDFNDINFQNRDYEEYVSYGQSKTCNILFSLALTKRYSNEGVYANSVMPGVIWTNLQRHTSKEDFHKRGFTNEKGEFLFPSKSIEEGAATSVWAAVAPELDGRGGLYLEDCKISEERSNIQEIFTHMFGYLPHAMNEKNADKLWSISQDFLNKRIA